MSAFTVGNRHINVMMQATVPQAPLPDSVSYYWAGEHHYVNGNHQRVGQKLVDENYRSVNYRYGEDNKPYRFRWSPMMPKYKPVEILKAIDCYVYQACETPDWKESEAHAIICMLRRRAIRMLDGYDEAQWEIMG